MVDFSVRTKGRAGKQPKDDLKGPFIEAFESLGTFSAACEKVGISDETLRRWRKNDPVFKEAIEWADEKFGERVERIAMEEGLRGRDVPVYFQGQQVGTYRERDPKVLLKLLEVRNQRYRQAARVQNFNIKVHAIIDQLTTAFVDMLNDRVLPSCPKCKHALPTRAHLLEGLNDLAQHFANAEVIDAALKEDPSEPVSQRSFEKKA